MAYERAWGQSLNNYFIPTANVDQARAVLWYVKALLLGQIGGLTTGLWTTYFSSDGTVPGTGVAGDGVDRWGAAYDGTKIIRGTAGNPHSWYVLKSPPMGPNAENFYLLLSFDAGADTSATFQAAKAAYVGGTNLANPTSTDSWAVGAAASQVSTNTGAGIPDRFNMILSEDGDFVFWYYQLALNTPNSPLLALMFVSPVGVNDADLYPLFTFKNYNPTTPPGAFTAGSLVTGTGYATRSNFSAVAVNHSLLATTTPILPLAVVDAWTSGYPIYPTEVGVFSTAFWHMRGRLPDIGFIGNTSSITPSIAYLRGTDGSIHHVLVGSLWLPLTAAPLWG